jgi:hypothetical protein
MINETGRVAPGCGPADPEGVHKPREGRDVTALPVTSPLGIPLKPCTCKHPPGRHTFGCEGGWFGLYCKCEGGMVDWDRLHE